MAQTGFTPLQIYSSSTAAAVPSASNLANTTLGSELAININDGKLFYKDNANAVQVIGWKVVPATAGGTGQTSYAIGDLLYADTTTTLAKLADVATGNALISGGVGVAPSWGKIGLTTHVSGVLPVANGGTNASTASITAFNNITGYTASGATGTTSTNLVFSTSPSITTPTFLGNVTLSTGNLIIGSATMTFPNTNATIARTDAAQTFSGTQTFDQVTTTTGTNNLTAGASTRFLFELTNTARNVGDEYTIRTYLGSNNSTSGYHLYSSTGGVVKATINGDGTYGSATNTYGSTSDLKLKQDIVDAGSQWNDVKSFKLKKYRYKSDPNGQLQLGVVAQDLEETSPGLVYETRDEDSKGNDLGTVTKNVKYSILYLKAVAALQEAMERIEKLEASISELKG